jgi:hypothetical protein
MATHLLSSQLNGIAAREAELVTGLTLACQKVLLFRIIELVNSQRRLLSQSRLFHQKSPCCFACLYHHTCSPNLLRIIPFFHPHHKHSL